ncbi:MAG: hypothetical protein HZB92_08230 [Euryarchaeota archaeon]|nr:hypothetical protein [Euryarchaeota archaeon]
MDFTLDAYSRLLDALAGYGVATVEDFLSGKASEPFCVLRHDVDRFPSRASRMARMEKARGVRATYYFRWMPEATPDFPGVPGFPEKEVLECKLFGHEVGYHYENLSEIGDKDKALEDFGSKLAILRELAPVRTVAMHGSPLSRVDNADLLRGVDLNKHGLLGDPHISGKFEDVAYITDTGRKWSSGEASVRDRLGRPLGERIKGTEHLVEVMNSQRYKRVMVNTHPQRWARGKVEWLSELVGQNVRNVGKMFLRSRQ